MATDDNVPEGFTRSEPYGMLVPADQKLELYGDWRSVFADAIQGIDPYDIDAKMTAMAQAVRRRMAPAGTALDKAAQRWGCAWLVLGRKRK